MPVEAASTGQQPAAPDPGGAQAPRSKRPIAIGLAALLTIAVVLGAVLLGGGDDDGGEGTAVERAPAAAVSPERLAQVAEEAGHPVYWAGERDGVTYELTQTEDGRVFVRYLPRDVEVGDPGREHLTVGTYVQDGAFEQLRATATAQGARLVAVPGGGRAFQDADRPTSAYVAYPGADVQVEVHDAEPGRALELVERGGIVAVGAGADAGAATAPRAATVADLRELAAERGRPVYWAGAVAGTTLELTETGDGRVYVRYLPSGVEVGDPGRAHLTIGTYEQPDAVEQLRRAAAASGTPTRSLPGGALSYADPSRPGSVYVGVPRGGVQVEVYDADPARAAELVASGRVVPVG